MKKIDEIIEAIGDESILIADGFDDAVIGIDLASMRVVYSVERCIEILIREGMDVEDAIEHFDYNVSGAYVGDQTPIFIHTFDSNI